MRALLIGLLTLCCGTGAWAQALTKQEKATIVPGGTLRAAIVTIPFLAKQDAAGKLSGVAPGLAEAMAKALDVPYRPAVFANPGAGVAAVRDGKADITFLAPTPDRVAAIDFAPEFMGMEVTLIVAASSPIQTLADADQAGRKIVVYEKSANEELVRKTVTKATIVTVPLFAYKKAFEMVRAGEADGYADLRDQLVSHQPDFAGSRIVPDAYGRNAMAIGYAKDKPDLAWFVGMFTKGAVQAGFVKTLIEKSGIHGAVAPSL